MFVFGLLQFGQGLVSLGHSSSHEDRNVFMTKCYLGGKNSAKCRAREPTHPRKWPRESLFLLWKPHDHFGVNKYLKVTKMLTI